MSKYTGLWLTGEMRSDGELSGMIVCPKDEAAQHDATNPNCACGPACSPLTGTKDDGAVALGVMISHRPFCEQCLID